MELQAIKKIKDAILDLQGAEQDLNAKAASLPESQSADAIALMACADNARTIRAQLESLLAAIPRGK
jgi:hypothetical protein